jgi:hypothetical protein
MKKAGSYPGYRLNSFIESITRRFVEKRGIGSNAS